MTLHNLFDAVALRALDSNADSQSGALLYVDLAGTTTAVTTYTESDGATENAHPVVADASGAFGGVYLDAGLYKVDLQTSAGVSLPGYPIDNVSIRPAVGPVRLSDDLVLVASGSSYTAPDSANWVRLIIAGAGGAGGGSEDTTGGGVSAGYGGNAGDSCYTGFIDVSTQKGFTISLGAGGEGVSGAAGSDGGTTTVTAASGGSWSIAGGRGGFSGGAVTSPRSNGSTRTNGPSTASSGIIKKGQRGLPNFVDGSTFARGGEGGSGPLGQGGASRQEGTAENGNDASDYGGGGGGAICPVSSAPRTGGDGGDAAIYVELYA